MEPSNETPAAARPVPVSEPEPEPQDEAVPVERRPDAPGDPGQQPGPPLPPAGPPPPRMTTTPTEYTPALLVRGYDVFMTYIASQLGDHIYQVLQEMRADAEGYAKQHKEKPKRVLAQLLGEVKDWRHIPVSKTDSATVLDQEVEAVKDAVPHLMDAVEDALRTGAMVLSGARGTSAEGITVKVPPVRDFVNDVYVRVAKEYSGRNGTARLYRHLTINKDKLVAEVKHAASAALFPRESVWGSPEELERTVAVLPAGADAPVAPSRKTIPLGNGAGGDPAPDGQAQQRTGAAEPPRAPPPDAGFDDAELGDAGSESGSEQEADDGF